MPPCMPAARRRSRWRRVVANGAAGATPTASSPWSWPSATRSATSGTPRVGRAIVGTRPSCRAPTGAATSTTRPRRWPARGAPSSRASDVTELGEQPRPRQQPDGSRLGDVDDHGLTGLARADERDHAVGAGIAALHGAVVAVDVEDPVAVVAIGTGHGRLLRGRSGPSPVDRVAEGVHPPPTLRMAYDNLAPRDPARCLQPQVL